METTATRASFGIDIITNSIRDLQQENAKNERKLSEVRSKKRMMESKYEAALSKCNQVSEIKGKMTDTMKMAQYKVSQSQAAIECQHGVNQELEERITHIKATTKSEETRQQEEIELLEGKLASLTDMFHNGREFYVDESLQGEIRATKKENVNLASKVNQTDTEAGRLVGLFEAMEIVAKKQEMEMGRLEVPLEVQHQVLNMFEQERTIADQELKKEKEIDRQLHSQLEE